jgi:hypothetical protein
MRLLIGECASPRGRHEKKIDALIIGEPVHDAHHREVCGAQDNTNLLVRFAHGRLRDALPAVEMASDNAVIAIFIPSMRASEEQHLVVTQEENVDRHWESGRHTFVLFTGTLPLAKRAQS